MGCATLDPSLLRVLEVLEGDVLWPRWVDSGVSLLLARVTMRQLHAHRGPQLHEHVACTMCVQLVGVQCR